MPVSCAKPLAKSFMCLTLPQCFVLLYSLLVLCKVYASLFQAPLDTPFGRSITRQRKDLESCGGQP
jgi:hypothetical protein